MQDDDRIQRRIERREADRRRMVRQWIALAVVASGLVAVVAGGIVWSRDRAVARSVEDRSGGGVQSLPIAGHASAAADSSRTGTVVANPSGAAAGIETVTAPAEPTPTVPAKKPLAGPDAVAKAAVPFPGAPAVSPTSINRLRPKHKYIAITLDDGYGFQPEMLKLLKRYNARCTTFLVGSWAANNKSAVKKMDAAGFEIANHTWLHETLTTLSASQERAVLLRTQKAISKVTGNQAPYMRPPGGATNPRVARVAAELGYKQVMWSRTFGDSAPHPKAARSYYLVMKYAGGVKPGDIILCHWGKPSTLEAMRRILPELKARGFEFVTVSELIADSRPAKSKKQ